MEYLFDPWKGYSMIYFVILQSISEADVQRQYKSHQCKGKVTTQMHVPKEHEPELCFSSALPSLVLWLSPLFLTGTLSHHLAFGEEPMFLSRHWNG